MRLSTAGARGRLPRLLRLGLLDQGAVRRDGRRTGLDARRPRSRCATANPDDAFTILLDPSRTQEEFGWTPSTPLEQGVADAIAYYRDYGIEETYTHLKLDVGEAAGSVSELRGATALVVGGAGFVGGNLVRELLERGAERVLVVDNLLSAERVNVPDDPRVAFVEGSIADDAVLDGLERRPTTTSSISPPTTATRARSRIRSTTTRTT